MTEPEWLGATDPKPMLGYLKGKVGDRKLRLLAVACCRRIWDGLQDARSRTAVEVAERFADGWVTESEMLAAHDEAAVAVDDCLEYSVFSEDQAIAAYLTAAAHVDEPLELFDPQGDAVLHSIDYAIDGLREEFEPKQATLVRELFGNPFRPVAANPSWLTSDVLILATGIYQERAFDRMPILADALQDAGCDNDDVLNHCRQPGEHVRGCWVVDLILGKK